MLFFCPLLPPILTFIHFPHCYQYPFTSLPVECRLPSIVPAATLNRSTASSLLSYSQPSPLKLPHPFLSFAYPQAPTPYRNPCIAGLLAPYPPVSLLTDTALVHAYTVNYIFSSVLNCISSQYLQFSENYISPFPPKNPSSQRALLFPYFHSTSTF